MQRSSGFRIPPRLIIGVGALIVFGIISLFVVSSDDVAEFNDKTVTLVEKMDKLFEKYGEEVGKYAEGQKVDQAFMVKERSRVEKKVKGYRSRIKGLAVPDCDLCRAFHKDLKAYVSNAIKWCSAFKKVNAYVKEHNPGSEEDIEKVGAMLAPLLEKEQEILDKVQASQKKMAAKYNLTLQ